MMRNLETAILVELIVLCYVIPAIVSVLCLLYLATVYPVLWVKNTRLGKWIEAHTEVTVCKNSSPVHFLPYVRIFPERLENSFFLNLEFGWAKWWIVFAYKRKRKTESAYLADLIREYYELEMMLKRSDISDNYRAYAQHRLNYILTYLNKD